MKVEIVGFYKNQDRKRRKLVGTLHAYLVDLELDIRGINVLKGGKGYFFQMPGRKTIDEETKESVWYPFFTFSDVQLHKDLINSIIEKGNEFLKKELTNAQ
jgi:DNA-binding cell septation regulator SpoVG